MKRIVLFLATNLAVMLVLSVVLNLLGADRFLAAEGLNVGMLLVFSAGRRLRRLDHLAADVEEDGQVVHRRARDRDADHRRRAVARGHGAALRREGRHRHARGRRLRGRAQRLCHRRLQELLAGRGLHGAAAVDVARGGRGGHRARGRAHRQRRHGHAHADPGRGEHVRGVPLARRRLRRRPCGVQDRARRRPGLLHHRDRLRDRVRHPRLAHRRVVLAPARVPCRRGLRRADEQPAPDDLGAAPPRRARAGRSCRSRSRPTASPKAAASSWACSRATRRSPSASPRWRAGNPERGAPPPKRLRGAGRRCRWRCSSAPPSSRTPPSTARA